MKEISPFVIQSEIDIAKARQEQFLAELRNGAFRTEERRQAYIAWSKPEAIAERKASVEEGAAAAKARGEETARLFIKRDDRADLQPQDKLAGITVKPLTKPYTYADAVTSGNWWLRLWKRSK